MNYYKITYQVFGLPMDLYYQCEARDEQQAREMFAAKCRGQIIKVEQVPFDERNPVYERPCENPLCGQDAPIPGSRYAM